MIIGNDEIKNNVVKIRDVKTRIEVNIFIHQF